MDALSTPGLARRGRDRWRRRRVSADPIDLREGAPGPGGGPRVLILGDDLGAAGSWEALLGAAGMEVSTGVVDSPDGPGASAPDLIILADAGGGDGPLTLLSRMRSEHSTARVPVILVTPGPGAGMTAALSAGADDWLCQPVRGAELVARVRARLRVPRG